MLKSLLYLISIPTLLFIISCSSSDETKENNETRDSLKLSKSIPPGTADIKAEILDYKEINDDLIFRLKILEVTAYGASTPPLPVGTEIKAYVPKDLLPDESQEIKEQKIIQARFSYFKTPGENQYWELVMFNK
jgi:hypothetical protein